MSVSIEKVCAGEYRYRTPIGAFALSNTTSGWNIAQWTPESGAVSYGTYPTKREADAEIASLFA